MGERAAARLDQVVCTLEGMATLFRRTPGDFAVVIHGDADCAAVVVQGMDYPGTERFFCTRIDEAEATLGKTSGRLEACLEAVSRQVEPGVIFLLGTCLSALVGEDERAIAARATERWGVPVVSLEGAGMGFVGQAQITDRFAQLMLGACDSKTQRSDGPAVNLLGFDPGRSTRDQLGQLGIRIGAVLVPGVPVSQWQRLPTGGLNLTLDAHLYRGFLERAGEKLGQDHLEVPFPIGLDSSLAFLEQVAAAAKLSGAADRARTWAADPRALVEAGRGRYGGARLGYNIGSMKNLDPRVLARGGLSDLPAFEELGFEVVVLVQGDDRADRVAAVRELLEGFGCRWPLAVFADTVEFGDLCDAHDCDLAYASDHLRSQLGQARCAFMPFGSLLPGLDGISSNLELLEAAWAAAGR